MLPAIYWGRVASGNGNYLVVLRILRESDFLFAARRSGPYFAMVVEGEILQKFVTY